MTETIVADARFDVVMTGEERYPIIGLEKLDFLVAEVLKEFRGLPLYAGCLEKATLAQQQFGGTIHLGMMRVTSGDGKSAYGFNYNPPTELHCWVEYGPLVIDLSLPGVIMRGLKLRDEVGPFLVDRTPSVLLGPPPSWLYYRTYEIL